MLLRAIDNRWFILFAFALCLFAGWTSYCYYEYGGMVKGHIKFAKALYKGTDFVLHPGIFWLSGLVHDLTALSIRESLFILTSLHVALIIPAIFWALRLLNYNRIEPQWVLLALALAIMVVAPIGLPTLKPHIYDFPKHRRTVFLLRSATLMAMLPYAIIAFGFLTKVIQQQIAERTFDRKAAIAAAAALFISSLIKPSFAVSICPAVGLYVLCKREIPWRAKINIACILLPTSFLLLAQIGTGIVYNPMRPVMSLEIAPFETWEHQNKNPLLAFILANAFSLFILGCRSNTLSSFSWIAWINLGISVAIYSLFAMNGPGDATRDLEWPYVTARQILCLCSAMELWKWLREKYSRPHQFFKSLGLQHIALILLITHTAFGYVRLATVDKALINLTGS